VSRGAAYRFAAATDSGKVRSSNEDAFFADARVLAVADGMGGHAAGEIAARIAIDTLTREMRRPGVRDPAQTLVAATQEANELIIDRANEYERFKGMGTTLTAAVMRKGMLTVAHVGDSRAYLLSGGVLHQITQDHSLVGEMVREGLLTSEEAAEHPQRAVITRALGASRSVEVDIVEVPIEEGDTLLLATDGLTSVLRDAAIEKTLARDAPPSEIATSLVAEANARGGPDNITVVVARYEGPGGSGGSAGGGGAPRTAGRAFLLWTVAFLAVLAAATGIFYLFLSHNYYLGFAGDTVAVYRGIPGKVLGIELSSVDRRTAIRRGELPAYYRDRLRETIPLADASEADPAIAQILASIPATATPPPASPRRPSPTMPPDGSPAPGPPPIQRR
jgi:PPM family protein phosphatase